MYIVKYGNEYLHDPRAETLLASATLEMEVNTSGTFVFTIYDDHPLFDKLEERNTENPVRIWQDDEQLFCGDILTIESGFELNKTVTCRSDLGWLNDSIARPYSTKDEELGEDAPAEVTAFFEWLIENHNSQVERTKRFKVGKNDGGLLDADNYFYRTDAEYSNTGIVLRESILDTLGGYVVTREEDGVRYIDLVADFEKVNAQVIDFGVNLLDYVRTDQSENMATYILPLGANLSETNYDYDDGYFETSDTKPVANKEYHVRSFKKCGAMTAFQSGVTYYEKKQAEFVTSDTKPFSGVDYYLKKFTKVNISKFAAGKTYYRLIDGVYTKVTGSYNKNYTYYTMSWEKQSLTAFASGKTYWEKETYYAQTSDSSPISGKDYYTLNRGSYSSKSDLGKFLKYETYYEYDENKDERGLPLTLDMWASDHVAEDFQRQNDIIYCESAVEKYGWIGASVRFEDITVLENLEERGLAALKGMMEPVSTAELTAVDLALVKPDYDPISICQYIRGRSAPHGFDSYMLVSKMNLDLLQPGQNKYTLGSTLDVLTGVQNKRIRSLNATINQVYESATAIGEDAKLAAKQAAEDAKLAQTNATFAAERAEQAALDAEAANTEAVEAKDAADAADVTAKTAQKEAEQAKTDAAKSQSDAEAAQAAANEAQQTADSIVQLVISTSRSATCRSPEDTVTATANVFRQGRKLDEAEVAELGTVRWYVNGAQVGEGMTRSISACDGTLKARLEV